MQILAIDPGNTESAITLIGPDLRPRFAYKWPNPDVRAYLRHSHDHRATDTLIAVEWIESMGMAVGKEVFDTCVWVGRFIESAPEPEQVHLITRRKVKLNLCGTSAAKDPNVRQALLDRFGDKGTKANPGWFYGFAGDMWSAYAVAVTLADQLAEAA